MLPECRTPDTTFAIPTFDLVPSDVEGFMDALWEFQSAFHDCFARSEPRAHFFDYMVGPLSPLARKSIEPMALHVDGGRSAGCSGLSVMWPGMRSRCCGMIISLSPRRWETPTGFSCSMRRVLSQRARTPWGSRGSSVGPSAKSTMVKWGC